jgi:RNA polymerase sigma-70 factor, ECF subfamily
MHPLVERPGAVAHALGAFGAGDCVRCARMALLETSLIGMATRDTVQQDLAALARIARGDPGGVAELYDRHSRLLYGLILRILRNPGDAEETLQEVFVLVWNRAGTYNPTLGSPAAWVVGIARNRAIDHFRATEVRRRTIEAAVGVDEPGGNPETVAAETEQQRLISSALDAIPENQRELIEEAFFFGFTHSELAERHRLPLGTVKTRIRTGLQMLREQLTQTGIVQ